MTNTNTFDITISGYPLNDIMLPNGSFQPFHLNGYSAFWKPYNKSIVETINLVNVETFLSLSYPIVKITINEKPISKFKKFWYDGWDNTKVYDIDIQAIDIKHVTYVTMRSKQTLLIDETCECLKNALDACIWTADSKYFV